MSNPIHYCTHKGETYYRKDYVDQLKEKLNKADTLWIKMQGDIEEAMLDIKSGRNDLALKRLEKWGL